MVKFVAEVDRKTAVETPSEFNGAVARGAIAEGNAAASEGVVTRVSPAIADSSRRTAQDAPPESAMVALQQSRQPRQAMRRRLLAFSCSQSEPNSRQPRLPTAASAGQPPCTAIAGTGLRVGERKACGCCVPSARCRGGAIHVATNCVECSGSSRPFFAPSTERFQPATTCVGVHR